MFVLKLSGILNILIGGARIYLKKYSNLEHYNCKQNTYFLLVDLGRFINEFRVGVLNTNSMAGLISVGVATLSSSKHFDR